MPLFRPLWYKSRSWLHLQNCHPCSGHHGVSQETYLHIFCLWCFSLDSVPLAIQTKMKRAREPRSLVRSLYVDTNLESNMATKDYKIILDQSSKMDMIKLKWKKTYFLVRSFKLDTNQEKKKIAMSPCLGKICICTC
jgi:hypothetical protein